MPFAGTGQLNIQDTISGTYIKGHSHALGLSRLKISLGESSELNIRPSDLGRVLVNVDLADFRAGEVAGVGDIEGDFGTVGTDRHDAQASVPRFSSSPIIPCTETHPNLKVE
jgi:hypothetical protein